MEEVAVKPDIIFDKMGRVLFQQTPNGHWVKFTYDRMGNVIYYEDSRGNWKRSKFDKNGQLIFAKNSRGETYGTETN